MSCVWRLDINERIEGVCIMIKRKETQSLNIPCLVWFQGVIADACSKGIPQGRFVVTQNLS